MNDIGVIKSKAHSYLALYWFGNDNFIFVFLRIFTLHCLSVFYTISFHVNSTYLVIILVYIINIKSVKITGIVQCFLLYAILSHANSVFFLPVSCLSPFKFIGFLFITHCTHINHQCMTCKYPLC